MYCNTQRYNDCIYAGFWKRLIAFIIDLVIMMFGSIGFSILTGYWFMLSNTVPSDNYIFYKVLFIFSFIFFPWVYMVSFETSKYKATVGKLLVGIEVTDVAGNRITILKATGRHFAKIITILTFGLGFLVICITDTRQSIHDILSNTLVLNKDKEEAHHQSQ